VRDQIFPQQRPEAQASLNLYEQSVGQVCDKLNAVENLRGKNERRMAQRLRRDKRSLLAQPVVAVGRASRAQSSPVQLDVVCFGCARERPGEAVGLERRLADALDAGGVRCDAAGVGVVRETADLDGMLR
jgi:hypothetical protein